MDWCGMGLFCLILVWGMHLWGNFSLHFRNPIWPPHAILGSGLLHVLITNFWIRQHGRGCDGCILSVLHIWSWWIHFWCYFHDDVIQWKHFPRHWPFVRGIHRSPVNSPHKGQWYGALMFFYLHPNKRLSKQWRGWWFETPSCPFWRHCNATFSDTIITGISQLTHITNYIQSSIVFGSDKPGTIGPWYEMENVDTHGRGTSECSGDPNSHETSMKTNIEYWFQQLFWQ